VHRLMNGTGRRRSAAARWGLPLGAALAALLGATEASAQVTAQGVDPTAQRQPHGGTDVRESNQMTLYYVSYEDCKQNISFEFMVDLGGASTTDFSVWASSTADCTQEIYRSGADLACFRLVDTYPSTGIVSFTAQQLVFPMLGITSCDSMATTTSFTTGAGGSTTVGVGVGGSFGVGGSVATDGTGPLPVNIYFLVGASSGDVTSMNDYTEWMNTQIDLVGPTPPTPSNLGVGDGEIIVNLPSNTDTDTLGYYIFCYPGGGGSTSSSTGGTTDAGKDDAGTDAGTTDAGTDGGTGGTGTGGAHTTSGAGGAHATGGAGGAGGFGGAGGAGGTGGTAVITTPCPAGTKLPSSIDPQHPDINSPYVCGSQIPASATSPNVTNLGDGTVLKDGQSYIVAVAAYDEVFNLGPLSTIQCQTPQQTTTFLDSYCMDGGLGCGGCGSCNIGAQTDPLWPVLGSLALAAVGISVRRQRRRR
jgi:hypothetical protein